jgi:hypothetical protein
LTEDELLTDAEVKALFDYADADLSAYGIGRGHRGVNLMNIARVTPIPGWVLPNSFAVTTPQEPGHRNY